MISLVIDTNIFFSAIYKKDGNERKILDLSIRAKEIQFFAPDIFWEEITRNLKRKLEYTEVFIKQIVAEFNILEVPFQNYKKCMDKARGLISHKNDVPFVSTSLFLNCPIWSGNKNHFKELRSKKEIVWFTTKELLHYLKDKNFSVENF
jgi:predicted nucleic acid-binding protein